MPPDALQCDSVGLPERVCTTSSLPKRSIPGIVTAQKGIPGRSTVGYTLFGVLLNGYTPLGSEDRSGIPLWEYTTHDMGDASGGDDADEAGPEEGKAGTGEQVQANLAASGPAPEVAPAAVAQEAPNEPRVAAGAEHEAVEPPKQEQGGGGAAAASAQSAGPEEEDYDSDLYNAIIAKHGHDLEVDALHMKEGDEEKEAKESPEKGAAAEEKEAAAVKESPEKKGAAAEEKEAAAVKKSPEKGAAAEAAAKAAVAQGTAEEVTEQGGPAAGEAAPMGGTEAQTPKQGACHATCSVADTVMTQWRHSDGIVTVLCHFCAIIEAYLCLQTCMYQGAVNVIDIIACTI